MAARALGRGRGDTGERCLARVGGGTRLRRKCTQRNQLHRCCQGPSLMGRGEAVSDVGEELCHLSLGWTPLHLRHLCCASHVPSFLLLPGAYSAWRAGLPSAVTEK